MLDLEEGKRIAHALGDGKAAILATTACSPSGTRVDEAAWWFVTMERSCQAQLLAEAAGTPVLIDPTWPRRPPGRPAATGPAGRSSSPSTTGSSAEHPDLLDE